ncbi:hypothetical protein V9T40_002182 [Parthenolecanium corni]|uniref:Uncharacterized protein n=1 Tax=Parthenolecanium corni TaxID=536013 RepID=A0AAN9Y3X6_9HEMI
MVILSSLVFTLFTEQFIFVNPNLSPAEPVDNDDPFSHLKRLVVKLPSTEGVGNNQNANVKVLSLQGFQNLPAAEIVGPRSCPFYHVTTVESQYLKRVREFELL